MFSWKTLFLTNSVRPSVLLRTYKNIKVKKPSRKSLYDKLSNKNVKGNPGGNRLLAMVLDDESPEKSDITLEDIEDGENDLLDSHLFYDQHMKEISKQKKFKSFQNIKRKYFKNDTVQPNFLTYFEKQQIKSLHEKSPKEWTPETLSLCFPVLPEIIIKILKSKWIADEAQKIIRHDKLVQDNWECFRNGLFNDVLSDELKNHLDKFSERRPSLITLKQAETYIPKSASDFLKPEEFGQIITSYIGESIHQNENLQIESRKTYNTEDIYENDTKTSTKKKHFTLEQVKNELQNESFSWYTPQTTLPTNKKSVDVATIESNLQEKTNIISREKVSSFIDTLNNYPLAIKIPKQVWKKGFMYKVNDCFYNDEGNFLYRVPGLITNENK